MAAFTPAVHARTTAHSVHQSDPLVGPHPAQTPAVPTTETDGVSQWLAAAGNSAAQSQLSDVATGQWARTYATGAATAAGEQAVQGWLNQFGTARVQLGTDEKFSLQDSAVDLLVPLYDNGQDVLFTQLGYRHKDSRNTLNSGLGVRLFRNGWMYGMNTFLDNDITGNNRRLGIGGEAWTDYLKLSANTYVGLTDWHQSRDLEDYDERPANGFDVAASAWLPAYPQLGGTLKYEQYRGDNVALINKDTLQKNPQAWTVGLNYTPVPLVTLGADYRNSNGVDDWQYQAQFTWRFGDSLSSQLSPSSVALSRSLSATRLDLVERNNNIVLDYRKQEVIHLSLPDTLHGKAGQILPVPVQVTTKHPFDRIEWSAALLEAAGGKMTALSPQQWQVQLPSYIPGGDNRYTLSAVAYDIKGNRSESVTMTVTVEGAAVDAAHSTVSLAEQTLPADGVSSTVMTFSLQDSAGNPVTGLADSFSFPDSFQPLTAAGPARSGDGYVSYSSVKEGKPGMYTVTVTAGVSAGTLSVTPVIQDIRLAPQTLSLTSSSLAIDSAKSTLVSAPATIPADDSTQTTLTFTALNSLGEKVSGLKDIAFTVEGVTGTSVSAVTEDNGVYSVTLK
ncbi:inverse autotransporter beta domain-containing protein, partial [Buttiauxella gaviniae]|uniref:inverse autotransporter beta domain-containing protein n=1 Tax=Buttiauxella gaviniae TaxID=82990 RepID=UPI0007E31B1B